VFASLSNVVQCAFVLGTGLLLDTFLVRTVTVPAIAVLCGRANWWHPRGWWPWRDRNQAVPRPADRLAGNRLLPDEARTPVVSADEDELICFSPHDGLRL